MLIFAVIFFFGMWFALWLAKRILSSLSWRFGLWLVLFLTLLAAVFSGEIVVSPAERVVMTLWSGSVVLLPVWWLVRPVIFGRRG